jgi:hypothetical protein
MSALPVPPPFNGLVLVDVPEQIVVSVISASEGFGSTVNVILNALPVQLPEVGVTEYVTGIAEFVELVTVPDVKEDAAVPLDMPESPVTTGALHAY